jgi:hypothetical protein
VAPRGGRAGDVWRGMRAGGFALLIVLFSESLCRPRAVDVG